MNLLPSHHIHFSRISWFVRLFAVSPLEKSTVLTRIQATFILLVTLATFGYELNGRIITKFHTRIISKSSTIVVGTLNTVTDVLCNVIVTLSPLFISEELKRIVLEEVEHLDKISSKYSRIKHEAKGFYLHLIILHLVYFTLLINDLSQWFDNNNESYLYQYYLWDQLYRYRLSMLVLYVFSFIYSLRQKISGINTILSEELEQILIQDLDSKLIKHLESVVQDISEAFAEFTHIIRHFNRMFGWQMLAIFFNYICLFIVAYEAGLRVARREGVTNRHLLTWASVSLVYSLVS
ncbi:7tm Chemosensory receptor [Popillia japonica]|uniref:Gustatory receptor n=1 Tax=Popillia japonica TaxID=7064 RepID=A0AAW1KIS1_POPJA